MSVTAPKGFLAGTAATGLRKSGQDDVCVIFSEDPCSAAGVFTRNQMAAAPIKQAKEALAGGALRAVVANSGNANACTGARGLTDARAMAAAAAEALGIGRDEVAVASTGVIGVPLDIDALLPGIASAAASLRPDAGEEAARAIMTTDTFPKTSTERFEVDGASYTVGAIAKGAGMIRPDMATMLAFVTTDAPLTAQQCKRILRRATDASFNRITVDGQTSTNDCVILMANGRAGGRLGDERIEEGASEAVEAVCRDLSLQIVRDGEGATKLIEVTVEGAADDDDARAAAMAVADSLLFKCAMFGEDANWGRVVSAVGASSVRVDPDSISVSFAGIPVARDGAAVAFSEEEAAAALAQDEVKVVVDLGIGDGSSTVWTCDISFEYVRVNSAYRT